MVSADQALVRAVGNLVVFLRRLSGVFTCLRPSARYYRQRNSSGLFYDDVHSVEPWVSTNVIDGVAQ